jgi:hypothetical protein
MRSEGMQQTPHWSQRIPWGILKPDGSHISCQAITYQDFLPGRAFPALLKRIMGASR